MDRRGFLWTSGLSIPALSRVTTHAPKVVSALKYKIGLQLYSINEDMKRDPIGTLKKVKAMGYEDFEIYGFENERLTYYRYPVNRFKDKLDELGLSVSSGHYGFSDFYNRSEVEMMKFVDDCIKGARAIESSYITWPWLHPDLRTIEVFKKLPALLNKIGKKITDAGLKFAYHNHGFEFEIGEEKNGYEIILEETDPDLVKLQMDMYWVMHAGKTTPKELVAKHPGRFTMWHIKDMDPVTRDYSELGSGSINYMNVLPDPVVSGMEYYYVEQGGNFALSALDSAASSIHYLKEHLIDKL